MQKVASESGGNTYGAGSNLAHGYAVYECAGVKPAAQLNRLVVHNGNRSETAAHGEEVHLGHEGHQIEQPPIG